MLDRNSIVTIGDTNYFPSVALSLLQANRLHPECSFAVYDWGFTEGERRFLRNEGAMIIDWRERFVQNPIPRVRVRVQTTLSSGASLRVKYMLVRHAITDILKNGQQGKEWLLAQKPYALLDWSKRNPEGTMLFLDGDALLMSRIDEIWNEQSELSVTVRRKAEVDFSFGYCQVINTGVIAFSGSTEVRSDIIQSWIDKMQERFEYLIEQSAMTRMVFNREKKLILGSIERFDTKGGTYSARILDCDTYNYNWIEEGVEPNQNKIVHFKGGRHSGRRFLELACTLGLERDLQHVLKWHGAAG